MASAEVLSPESPRDPSGDEPRFEVIDGRRVELPPMGARESLLAFLIAAALRDHARAHQLGHACAEVLFQLRARTPLQRKPDAAFVSFERWPKGRLIPSGNAWDVVPDLAVEVISPMHTAAEVARKLRHYFRAGVRLAWVVYPDERLIYVHDSPRSIRVVGVEDVLEGGDVLPGFRYPVAELFEDIAVEEGDDEVVDA